jgi:hypothetical protein
VARTIHIHRPVAVAFDPIGELVGVAGIRAVIPADSGGGMPTEVPLSGLAFTDADGETHVFVMDDEVKQIVLRHLTGGVILPGG